MPSNTCIIRSISVCLDVFSLNKPPNQTVCELQFVAQNDLYGAVLWQGMLSCILFQRPLPRVQTNEKLVLSCQVESLLLSVSSWTSFSVTYFGGRICKKSV